MLITLKAVTIEQRPARGKGQPYEMAEIIFTDDRSPQVKTFKLISFTNPQGFTLIKAAKPGDQFDVTVVKGDDGYNKWTTISAAGGSGSSAPAAGNTSAPRQGQTNSFAGRDFETKDERELKQRLIVRQSSVAQAVAMLTPGAKTAIELDKVTDLADELVAYVYQAPKLFDTPPASEESDDIPY